MHVGLTIRGKNFPGARDTASLTFSVRRFSKFEILKPSPPFCHCLLLVRSGASNKPSQPVASPSLTKFVFKVISTKAFWQYTVFPPLSIYKPRGIKRLRPSFFLEELSGFGPPFLSIGNQPERNQAVLTHLSTLYAPAISLEVSSGFGPPR